MFIKLNLIFQKIAVITGKTVVFFTFLKNFPLFESNFLKFH